MVIAVLVVVNLPVFIYASIIHVHTVLEEGSIDNNFFLYLLPSLMGIAITFLISIWLSKYKRTSFLSLLGRYSLFIFGLHANNGFLEPIILKISAIVIPISSMEIIGKTWQYGIVKTVICILFFLVVGILLKHLFPFFFGYLSNDKILAKLRELSK